MFNVIEFCEEEGGGVSVIREQWLTPRKKNCLWPPHKLSNKFHKCINGTIEPDESWKIHKIKRIFYETDSLIKAREKAKLAEIDSEVNSDDCDIRIRRRTKKIYDSDDTSDDHIDDNSSLIINPTPPATCIESQQYRQTPAGKQLPLEKQGVLPQESMPDISLLDLTLTPLLKDLPPKSDALDVIAKHLAHIENSIKELQTSQQEILTRIRCSSATSLEVLIPDDITLPCDDNEAMNKLEYWISIEENSKHLINYLSFVGGNKIPTIIRRILEKVFTNRFALLCNWTGKNNKIPLKDLTLIKIIREAVCQNKIAEKVTDAEIHEVISNWFRFARDRNGGRDARRARH